jgi:two-component system, NtrC family, response regulator AtoC
VALILIVEDEKLLRWTLDQRLKKLGHETHLAENLREASEHLDSHRPDVVLLDLGLPDGNGLDFYEVNRERLEETVVLVMTAVGQVEDAVRAMKLGALDFLTKPVDHEVLVKLVDRSLAVRSDSLEAKAARASREKQLKGEVVAVSPSFRRTLEITSDVAVSDVSSVLILGESGCGKNVVARHLHACSHRKDRPFLEVNCPAIPDQLVESELFGHERGAFTDAKASKAGSFELADGGTVVLDEVAEIRSEIQSKLLHFLEGRSFRRVGGLREIRVDVRVVALTNRDLKDAVATGHFRNDLYHRLSVFPITVPALRDRAEDILPLAKHFLQSLQGRSSRRIDGFDRSAQNLLIAYPWPGNVRELRNVVERATILEKSNSITPASLILEGVGLQSSTGDAQAFPDGIIPLEEVEMEMVRRALHAAGGNQSRAAELLGVSRDQLRYRVKKYGW